MLDVSRNRLGAKGARALSAALQLVAGLEELNVGDNKIGARALAAVLQHVAGLELDVRSNNIGANGEEALRTAAAAVGPGLRVIFA
jgi:hypothetical protein